MKARSRFAIVFATALAVAVGLVSAPPAAGSMAGSDRPQRNPLCEVSVQRIADLWGAMETWAGAQKESGDAVAEAMSQMLGSSDPSDLEVLEMQKEVAQDDLKRVRDFQAREMQADLSELLRLSGQLRSSVPRKHHSYVKARVAKIRSLYKEHWSGVFASTFISAYQALTGADIQGWASLTEPLPAKVTLAHDAFDQSFRGLPKLC